MKKISIILLFICSFQTYSQQVALTTELNKNVQSSPIERVWLGINNSSFFPSEYLYFNLYCLDNKLNKPSDLSKVAYISIRDSNNKTILTKRVALDNGFAQGEVFISADLKTGSYQLLGYTQWMLNFSPELIYTQELYVINPYTNAKLRNDSLEQEDKNVSSKELSSSSSVQLSLNENYSTREKVTISIKSEDYKATNLPLSISVRKVNDLKAPYFEAVDQYKSPKLLRNDSIWLPEHRGAYLSGNLSNQYPDSLKTFISQISGNQLIRKIEREKNGDFVLINQQLTDDFPIKIQDGSPYNKENEIQFNALPQLNQYNWKPTFTPLKESDKSQIIKRSLYNQIENNYLEFKPDSLRIDSNTHFLKYLSSIDYDLKEYTRFASIKETFKELIVQVSVDQIDNKEIVKIKQLYSNPTYLNALLLMDGIVIPNATQLFTYDARDIDKISVYPHPIVLGGDTYNGAILFSGNNPIANYLERGTTVPKGLLVSSIKSYYKQDHSLKSNLPDYRQQLLWNPNVSINDNYTTSFYTSDVSGTFEVSIQGIDSNGKPFRTLTFFEVTD